MPGDPYMKGKRIPDHEFMKILKWRTVHDSRDYGMYKEVISAVKDGDISEGDFVLGIFGEVFQVKQKELVYIGQSPW